MAASLATFYYGAKICHVEAGLRTYNKKAPFPEEINRVLTTQIADIHLTPTEIAKTNLLRENVTEKTIEVTGNTVIDALLKSVDIVNNDYVDDEIESLKLCLDFTKNIILVTGHRRENFGDGFLRICEALNEISKHKNVQVVYPVHLNPNVQKPVYNILKNNKNVKLIAPLAYPAFVWLMNKSKLIITDSGGVQEEAPSLGKPVLVMRETTERPEAVEAGTVILVGTDKEKIVNETISLLDNFEKYEQMSKLHNPYGDGKASRRIKEYIIKQFKKDKTEIYA
jgi:UDP-N-acetylglucosamine 2-epimerase (non-hydrolysing)